MLDNADAFLGDDLVIEADDAVLGMYSTQGGAFGSALVFGELDDAGNFIDKWAMIRRTSTTNGELQFTYGPSTNYGGNPVNFALRPSGSAFLRGSLTQNSTAREKHDVATIQDAIETLLQLRGVRYQWNETNKNDIGFIAEEMVSVLPEIVGFDSNGKPIGIDYGRVTALIVEATKEQQRQLDEQSQLIQELLLRVQSLENQRE